jgi:serine/threonine-protein kinase
MIERYELLGELATGGMATVFLGRQHGAFGFSRTVAIKSMHPQFAKDDGFRAMFLDEATITAKIRHPNVVPTLDIVSRDNKVLLVMEYVDGVSLSALLRAALVQHKPIDPSILVTIIRDALLGLHAAHELLDDDGHPLAVVHRDVSPQNIHVGADGLTRVLDFGVAKASTRRYVTQTGEIKGKIPYMSPEQLHGETLDRRTDVYAAGVCLWEALAGRRLFHGSNEGEVVRQILDAKSVPPSFVSEMPLSEALDSVVLKALAQQREDRWATAEEMANALANALPPVVPRAVSDTVKGLAHAELDKRASMLRAEAAAAKQTDTESQAVARILTQHATQTSVPAAMHPSRRRRRIMAIFAGVVGIAVLTGGSFVVGSRSANARRELRVTPTPVVTGDRSGVPHVERIASAADKSDEAGAPDFLTDTARPIPPRPSASTSASARTHPLPRQTPAEKASPPARPSATVDCRTPYVVDAEGFRHYRAECVE